MVSSKLLILSKKWRAHHQGICVLTHTNVAKDEIVERLKKSTHGEKLLSYPHFIGTIQEFVNRFLAIPYLRSSGYQINQIDDDACCKKGWFLLQRGTRTYLEKNRVTSLHGMEYKLIDGEFELSVPGFKKKSDSKSYKDLKSVKEELMGLGFFYYNEMYAFAEHYLLSNNKIKDAMRSRFPVVFIDEMQDTQKFQDDFLNDLFSHDDVKLQRFGDPDQAIYSGNEDEGNQSYNLATLDKVEDSHRFNNSVALLARNLSFNRINLYSDKEAPEGTLHTIFLVDDNSRSKVFESFANLCSQAIPVDCTRKIKTVGAVGVKKEDGLTICSYLDSYDKKNSISAFKPSKLIHYFYEAKCQSTWYETYRLILEGVVKCGRISNTDIKYEDGKSAWYSVTSLRRYLKETGLNIEFNILFRELITNEINEDLWLESVIRVCGYLGLDISGELRDFILFESENNAIDSDDQKVTNNKVCLEVDGKMINNEVTTIHSVKGETHAATLVLETKYYQNDVSSLIEYILKDKTDKPKAKRKVKFMKQLYVAFSRPEHLLCVAIDKSGFPVQHVNKSEYAGWKICDLTVD